MRKQRYNMNARFRSFSLVSYLSVEDFEILLHRHISDIVRYAYVVHDRDLEDDMKTPEQVHITCLLYTYNAHSVTAIRKWFSHSCGQNTLAQIPDNEFNAYDYLIHANAKEPNKWHYDESDIVKYNFNLEDLEQDDNGFAPLQMLLDGVDKRIVAKRFGRDFIYHYHAYKALAEDILFEEKNRCFAEDLVQIEIDKKIF